MQRTNTYAKNLTQLSRREVELKTHGQIDITQQVMNWVVSLVNLGCLTALLVQLINVVVDQQLNPSLTNTR